MKFRYRVIGPFGEVERRVNAETAIETAKELSKNGKLYQVVDAENGNEEVFRSAP